MQLKKFDLNFNCLPKVKISLTIQCPIEAGTMRQVVLWDTACNFNAVILNQSIFNCLITSASTLIHKKMQRYL